MRRALGIIALTIGVYSGSAWAGPGGASGPITVDSTTFVAGSSVMGTDGGFYSSSPQAVGSGTTGAFGMTRFRAEHVNLRDASGTELGTVGNPLYTTASSSITIGVVTVSNSSFSVTGSTVTIAQPTAANLNATVVQGTPASLRSSVSIDGSSNTVKATQNGTWNVNNTSVNVATVTISGTPNVAVTNTPSVTLGAALPVGTNNIGTVTNSTVTVRTAVGNNLGVSVNNSITATIGSALPAGTNNIGTVSGSTVTLGNPNVNVINTPNVNVLSAPSTVVTQSTPASLKASVSISGSSNTVQSAQSGSWAVTAQQAQASSLQASVSINGSSNTVQAAQSGSWTATATQSTPASLKASVSISGSSNTVSQGGAPWTMDITKVNGTSITGSSVPVTGSFSVSMSSTTHSVTSYQGGTWNVGQSGSWTDTVTQGTNSNLRASVAIDGSSNTVTANQGGSWTATTTQGTNANLRASVAIDGSSNTVVLGAGTANIGKIVFQTPAVSALTYSGITFSATGDNVIISTQTSQTVRIYRMFFVVSAATTITVKSGGATLLTGPMTFLTGGSFVLDLQGDPWFTTNSSQAFILNQTGTAQVSGAAYYLQN